MSARRGAFLPSGMRATLSQPHPIMSQTSEHFDLVVARVNHANSFCQLPRTNALNQSRHQLPCSIRQGPRHTAHTPGR